MPLVAFDVKYRAVEITTAIFHITVKYPPVWFFFSDEKKQISEVVACSLVMRVFLFRFASLYIKRNTIHFSKRHAFVKENLEGGFKLFISITLNFIW